MTARGHALTVWDSGRISMRHRTCDQILFFLIKRIDARENLAHKLKAQGKPQP